MTKSDRVVYTCITGGYDDVQTQGYVNPEWDYILFTDNAEAIERGHTSHWQVREIPFRGLDNSRNSRYPKINAHLVLSDYKYSLYVDGNLNIKTPSLFERVESKIASGALISIPPHPKRECIYDEADMVIVSDIDNRESVERTMQHLHSKGYPRKNGLFENCIIFREHNNPQVAATMELWWEMLCNFSRRDQLSFCYAAYENGLKIEPLYPAGESHRKDPDLEFMEGVKHTRYIANSDQGDKRYPKFLINFLAIFIRDDNKRRLFRVKYRVR